VEVLAALRLADLLGALEQEKLVVFVDHTINLTWVC